MVETQKFLGYRNSGNRNPYYARYEVIVSKGMSILDAISTLEDGNRTLAIITDEPETFLTLETHELVGKSLEV